MKATSKISFAPPLAYSRDYPPPAFTVHPTHNNPYNPSSGSERLAPPGIEATFHVARARYAFALIALASLKPGNTVLLPAYHCPAMVEPFLWAGCTVAFYPVTESLTPVSTQLEVQLEEAHAVVFTRYFGFEQVTEQLIVKARNHHCLVIEDLAHAAFISKLHGDVGVTSLAKFFPQPHGSEIWCADHLLAERLKQVITSQQLSQAGWALSSLYRKIRKRLASKMGKRKGNQSSYRYFNEIELKRPSALCRLQVSGKRPRASERQGHRIHYQRLLEIASRSPLGTPLYPELPPDTIPYMFPFLLHTAQSFHLIRRAGIPLYRWEELVPTDCEVSTSYRARLIQIPCHQDMRAEDFALIDQCLSADSMDKSSIMGKTA